MDPNQHREIGGICRSIHIQEEAVLVREVGCSIDRRAEAQR